jgi:general L-amino acid transport system permease protein
VRAIGGELLRDEDVRPPITRIGALGWIRANLFNGSWSSLTTIVLLYLLWQAAGPLIRWFLIDAVWTGSAETCRAADGACWAFVREKLRFILFGFYPYGEQWRPLLTIAILIFTLLYSRNRAHWKMSLVRIWAASIAAIVILMYGGILGLTKVSYEQWGGLPLTLFISLVAIVGAYPLGVLLAFGRRSGHPVLRYFCILYIELIRGVPLISLLFMSAVMFPLFLPEGIVIDKLLRAQIAIILFTAAYLAEVVRGGLQAIPRAQYEAASSLSLNSYHTIRLIILPQALRIVIPPTVNHFIGVVRDSSLVLMIALLDLLNTTKTALTDPYWMGFSYEAYFFAGAIYFIICFSMAKESRRLEKDLKRDSST